MNLKGTIILSIVSLLERLSYYGVRAILVLYLTDPKSFNLNVERSLEYYAIWATLIICVSIPISLVTDKILGQRKSIYIGGIMCLIGYSLLALGYTTSLILGLTLILVGTSLVKPSTVILIGRQFVKEDKKRTLAFMILFSGINIGAFIGILGIGYLGETYSWKLAFLIAAVSTLIYLVSFHLLQNYIVEQETNELEMSSFSFTFRKSLIILPIIVFIHIVFWKSYHTETSDLLFNLSNVNDQSFFGFEVLSSMYDGLTAIWTMPLTILLFIYWYKKGVTNFFKSISISLLLLLIAIPFTKIILSYEIKYLLEISLIPLGIYAFAEILISPMITSYVTRISDVNYSNTIYSFFILLTYLLGGGLIKILPTELQTFWILGLISITIVGFVVFKSQIRKLTNGLE